VLQPVPVRMNPIPVPPECVDMLPTSMWEVWHKCKQDHPAWGGELPALGPVKKRKIWKNHWHQFIIKNKKDPQAKPEFPHVSVPKLFLNEYCKKFPDGHNDGEAIYTPRWQHTCGWIDHKHGYFRGQSGLIYRHPNGQTYLCTGADEIPACGCK